MCLLKFHIELIRIYLQLVYRVSLTELVVSGANHQAWALEYCFSCSISLLRTWLVLVALIPKHCDSHIACTRKGALMVRTFFFYLFADLFQQVFNRISRIQQNSIFSRRHMFLLVTWWIANADVSIDCCFLPETIDAFTHDCLWNVVVLLLIVFFVTYCCCLNCVVRSVGKRSYSRHFFSVLKKRKVHTCKPHRWRTSSNTSQ